MKQAGFSLIELVIVVAIMGLLGLVAVPSFTAIQNKAKNTTLKSTAHTLEMSLETYAMDNGDYPDGQNLTAESLSETLISAGVMSNIPINPFTNKAFDASDTKGKITYTKTATGYAMTLYGNDTAPIATLVR